MNKPSFDINTDLKQLFSYVDSNKIVVPNFQRDYVWKPDQQPNLLASLLAGVPLGAMLILEGNPDLFRSKKLCTTAYIDSSTEDNEKVLYLLDGQQRLSTLYSQLCNLLGSTKYITNHLEVFNDLKMRWFLDLNISNHQEDIWGILDLNFNENNLKNPDTIKNSLFCEKTLKTHKTKKGHPSFFNKFIEEEGSKKSGEDEYIKFLASEKKVPLWDERLFDFVLERIAQKQEDRLKNQAEESGENAQDILEAREWTRKVKEHFFEAKKSAIPIIKLDEDDWDRAIAIFENINRGGTPLSVFDLIVARYAQKGDEENFADKILSALGKPIEIPKDFEWGITEWSSNDCFGSESSGRLDPKVKNVFLDVLGLYVSKEKAVDKDYSLDGTKKSFLLSLETDEIRKNWELILKSIQRTFVFLQANCGVTSINELHYQLLMWPIAIIFTNDDYWLDKGVHKKIKYWYWSTAFNSYFSKHQNRNAVNDLRDLLKWINNNKNPFEARFEKMFEQEEYCNVDIMLNEVDGYNTPIAVERFLEQYIISKKPNDFSITNPVEINALTTYQSRSKIERHHVIPLAEKKTLKESTEFLRKQKDHILNSVLNMTPITSEANRKIGALPLSQYKQDINKDALSEHFFNDIGDIDFRSDQQIKVFLKNRLENIKRAIKDTVKL